MSLALSAPVLRAHMEADMKAISLGTKSKEQVLASILEDMKNVNQIIHGSILAISCCPLLHKQVGIVTLFVYECSVRYILP